MTTYSIKKNLHRTSFLLAGILVLLSFAGCKKEKGCTDKNALNYNSVAEENDGTCIYCKLEEKEIGNRTVYLVDENWSSPYHNQNVARFNLTQVTKKYNDQQCGKDECNIAVTIHSMVDKQMEFSYWLQISNFGGNPTQYVLINPYQTLPQDSIINLNSFNCESIDNSTISVSLSGGYIEYH